MRKIYMKLVAISLALILSVSVVVMSSYAWFVLSSSPVVSGIQVTIGGGNTILVAADLTETVDGVTYHYPAAFSDKLNFGQHESYEYLQSLGGLTPVSTADGVHWFLPEYYDDSDEAVQEGKVPSGQIKDISEFTLDDNLEYVNLPGTEEDKIEEGHYIYLDFWVVSPGADYKLRLSTGEDSGGSFLIDLLQPVQKSDGTYTLAAPEHEGSAAARVGFLVNPNRVLDNSMLYYQHTAGFNDLYTELRGNYFEPRSEYSYTDTYRFTIYEPNGTYHPNNVAPFGSYVPTLPIALLDGTPSEASVMNLVTVQESSSWAYPEGSDEYTVEQIFQTAMFGKDLSEMDTAQISDTFYNEYLQGQISTFVKKGQFYKRSNDLSKYSNLITAEELAALDTAGATDDVYIIELERNVPQRIRMFIWLEGQDVDCNDSVRASTFALNIELAGGNE